MELKDTVLIRSIVLKRSRNFEPPEDTPVVTEGVAPKKKDRAILWFLFFAIGTLLICAVFIAFFGPVGLNILLFALGTLFIPFFLLTYWEYTIGIWLTAISVSIFVIFFQFYFAVNPVINLLIFGLAFLGYKALQKKFSKTRGTKKTRAKNPKPRIRWTEEYVLKGALLVLSAFISLNLAYSYYKSHLKYKHLPFYHPHQGLPRGGGILFLPHFSLSLWFPESPEYGLADAPDVTELFSDVPYYHTLIRNYNFHELGEKPKTGFLAIGSSTHNSFAELMPFALKPPLRKVIQSAAFRLQTLYQELEPHNLSPEFKGYLQYGDYRMDYLGQRRQATYYFAMASLNEQDMETEIIYYLSTFQFHD